MKSLNVNKKVVDEKLDFFINKKNKYKYSKKFVFDIQNIYNLGYILSYSFSKFSKFKIYNDKDLRANVDKTKQEQVDALTLFFADSIEKSKSPEECSKTLFCKKNKNKFYIPGPYIFLINIFIYINTIEINFNFDEPKLTRDDVNLFILSLLNIQYLFQSKITIKINLINEELQCSVYRRFYKELFQKTPNGSFKMIYMNKDDVYKKKWDFETEFLLEKHRRYKKTLSENIFNINAIIDENEQINNNSKIIYKTPNKNDFFNNSYNNKSAGIKSNYFRVKTNFFSNKNLTMFNLKEDESNSNNNTNTSISSKNSSSINSFISNKSQYSYSSNSVYRIKNNPNENIEDLHYHNIIDKFKKSIGLMLITIDSLNNFTNMKRLDLILNDCYQSEFYLYFLYNNCISEISNKFNIVDILINKVRNLNEFNIELNILDHITFNKILSFIYYNLSMTSIKISFFSSDATYLRQTLYKIYYQNLGSIAISITRIINLILPYFIDNLEVLFELIKIKDFKKIAVNFDIPSIIEINNSYMNTIFKFLMNLLFLVDNRNTRIEKLVILSPSTKFDARLLPSIDNILEDINFNENNEFLTELSLHIQLYMIKNIKNLITERLIILNIGNCDLYTFHELTKFLKSYNFSRKSSLQKLSVSLLDSFINYTYDIKIMFYILFSIKLKNLYEINVYTNINMSKETYIDFIYIFRNNWISKYRVIFNPKSEIYFNNIEDIIEEENDITYLVSHSLEDKLLSSEELVIRDKIFINKDKKNIITQDKDDNIYWILWQLFHKKDKKSNPNIVIRKNTIFNILKYLYFTKTVKIKNKLE